MTHSNILLTQCIYGFHVIITTNSDHLSEVHTYLPRKGDAVIFLSDKN